MNKNINIVVPMAGEGIRFREAGYQVPKYQIQAQGKSLFELSVCSLKGFNDSAKRYIFIVREEDNALDFISEQCKVMGLNSVEVIELNHNTDGQATTVMHSAKYWNTDDRLLIYNIDTFVEPNIMSSFDLRGDGFIHCFKGVGEHYSFVKLDSTGRVVEVKEKSRISDYCSLGTYYFSNCHMYSQLYEMYNTGKIKPVNNERYIAPLYNELISRGGDVYISNVDAKYVHILGTPKELEYFEKNYKGF